MSEDIFYSPKAPKGKPSYQALADKAARQKARIDFLQAQAKAVMENPPRSSSTLTSSTQAASTSTQAASTTTQAASTTTQAASTTTQAASTTTQAASTTTQAASTTTQAASTSDEDAGAIPPARRLRTFSLAFKRHVANYAASHSVRSTAEHFKLDRKVVRTWRENQALYQSETLLIDIRLDFLGFVLAAIM
jgi:hypothetical protein